MIYVIANSSKKVMRNCTPVIGSLTPTIKLQILLFLFPYISYGSGGENLFKYQQNLTGEIMFSILIIYLTDKTLILQ